MEISVIFTWIAALTAVACALGFLLYKYISRNDDYWKKRGVTYLPRMNIFSALQLLAKKTLNEIVMDNAKKYGKIFGAFEGSKPLLSVADPDLLRDILVKDFHIFPYRREIKTGDPITDSLVSLLTGDDWKRVRTIITPAFTSKRMRQMSSIINGSSKSVADALEKGSQNEEAVDFKSIFGAFTMDVIASSAFGTKIDVYNDPKNIFVKKVKENFITLNLWRVLMFMILPLRVIRLFFRPSKFFEDVVKEVIKTRREQKKIYNDVLQILMDASEEQGQAGSSDLNVDEEDRYGSIVNSGQQSQIKYKNLSQDEVLAQCVLFFIVGYETSATTLTFLAYALATNPDWQEKLIAEVDDAFKKHSEMSYDAVRSMKVLDAVICETLRMYPPLVATERTAVEDYELGDTGITIEKGMRVAVQIYALHFDSEYFKDPEKFDPGRFMDSSQSSYPQYAYLPFGAGPRNCLGMRFALLEIKLCITNLLRRYRFRTHSTTKVPLEFRKAFQFLSVNEMPLAVEKRTDV